MPVYEYEHEEPPCSLGKVFEIEQPINDWALTRCPECNGPVRKLMSLANIKHQKGDSELRDLGFTKLVRRDDGVYENVTRREGESRYMEKGKPESLPHLNKIISD